MISFAQTLEPWGRVRANSSVSKNGTIRLLARDDAVAQPTDVESARAPVVGRPRWAGAVAGQLLADLLLGPSEFGFAAYDW